MKTLIAILTLLPLLAFGGVTTGPTTASTVGGITNGQPNVTLVNPIIVGIINPTNLPTPANFLVVDSVLGRDATATRCNWSQSWSNLSTALLSARYGDTIYLNGGQQKVITNFTIPSGVTIVGTNGALIISTNNTTSETSIFNLGNDVTLKNLTITAKTNAFGSMFGAQLTAFTNLLVDNCYMTVGYDWLFGGFIGSMTVRNSTIFGDWDFIYLSTSASVSPRIFSVNNTYLMRQGFAPSRIDVGGNGFFYDSGSYFQMLNNGFTNTSYYHFGGKYISLHGTQISRDATNVVLFGTNSITQTRSGSYYDVGFGEYTSIGADSAQYYTSISSYVTNTVYTNSGLALTGGGIALANNIYRIQTSTGDIINDQANPAVTATWTNVLNGYRVTLNNADAVGLVGAPVYCVATNGDEILYFTQDFFPTQLAFNTLDGIDPPPTSLWFTNTTTITTNLVYTPQMLGGRIKQETNGIISITTPLSIPTNSISTWPATPTYRGQAVIVNSNGTVYGLKSGANGATWVSTNLIF